MYRGAKRHLSQSFVDLALILALLRQSDVDILSSWRENDDTFQYEAYHEEGPLLGIVSSPAGHFQQPWGGPRLLHKSVDGHYDSAMDEYDRIMSDIRSRPPAMLNSRNSRQREYATYRNRGNLHNNDETRDAITMVLSISNEVSSWQRSAGGARVSAHNVRSEGAVGGMGVGLPYSADESFDVFSRFTPENMQEGEINHLLLSESTNTANLASNQMNREINWQQYLTDYDNIVTDARSSMKGFNGSFGNWGNFDILNEAVQNAELFLPVVASNQNSTVTDSTSDFQECEDSATASRLEVIEYNEWASQNHEYDLLFPSLPPPCYEEAVAMEQSNSTSETVVASQESRGVDHMHDHNYFNATSVPASDETGSQRAGYAIISRQRVATRVVTVSTRPRHVSTGTDSSISEASDVDLTSDLASTEVMRSPIHRITVGSDSGIEESTEESLNGFELNSFEVKPLNLSYFENLNKDVALRREVILCN